MISHLLHILIQLIVIIISHEHRLTETEQPSFDIQDVTLYSTNGTTIAGPLLVIVTLKSSNNISQLNETFFDNIFVALFTKVVYIIPEVKLIPPNIYVLKALVVDSGEYKIVVRTEWIGWPDSQEECVAHSLNIDNKKHTVSDARLVITANFTRSEYKNERFCSPVESFIGRFYTSREHSIPSSGVLSEHMDMRFQPYGCSLRYFKSSRDIRHALPKSIIFLGDSTLEVVFKGLLNRIYGEGMFTSKHNAAAFRAELQQYHFDGGPKMNRWFDYSDPWGGPRLTFMFDGGPRPSDNYIGAALSKFPWGNDSQSDHPSMYFMELRRVIREGILACRPTVVLFNTGVHDVASPLFTFDDYKRGLNTSFSLLQELISFELSSRDNSEHCSISSIPITVYWVTTVPFMHGSGRNSQYSHGFQCSYFGNAGIKKLNELAIPLAALHGIQILDHFALRLPFQRDGDGLHCQEKYFQEGDAIVEPSCQILVDAFLNALL